MDDFGAAGQGDLQRFSSAKLDVVAGFDTHPGVSHLVHGPVKSFAAIEYGFPDVLVRSEFEGSVAFKKRFFESLEIHGQVQHVKSPKAATEATCSGFPRLEVARNLSERVC